MTDKMYLVIGFKNGSEARIPYDPRKTSVSVSTNIDGNIRKINLSSVYTNLYYTNIEEVNYVYTMEAEND